MDTTVPFWTTEIEDDDDGDDDGNCGGDCGGDGDDCGGGGGGGDDDDFGGDGGGVDTSVPPCFGRIVVDLVATIMLTSC